MHRSATLFIVMSFFSAFCAAQGSFRLPSLNEVRMGQMKQFKVPTIKDFNSFTSDYTKHLALLDRRSEKAYRKSFLKFLAIEDELLYTLCDSNEFRANMLMRSANSSFGKMERDRNRKSGASQQKRSHQRDKLDAVVDVSQKIVPEIDDQGLADAKKNHETSNAKFGTKMYSIYMDNRAMIYKETFREGSKKQKRLLRKLRKRALLWKSYKANDQELIKGFADGNMNIMRSVKATDEYRGAMKSAMPDYSGTHADAAGGGISSFDKDALLAKFKETMGSQGLLSQEQLAGAESISELFKAMKEAKKALPDSLKPELGSEPIKLNTQSSERFWDRLYGGIDFDWENSTGYYPDGLGITATGGYKISQNAGLNLELSSIFNASRFGFRDDKRFESTLISNYTAGANVDHRIWKVLYGGVGAELIINQIEAPSGRLLHELKNPKYTLGVPLILKAILPVGGSKSTTLELRYDLNSKNNIKPSFDFKVGFLIGR